MPYAVTCCLAPASADRVRSLWEVLAREGLSDSAVRLGYEPHITLAILDDTADATALIDATSGVAADWTALPITCAALAVFTAAPATLWVAPTATAELLRRHTAITAALPAAPLHPHYRPGAWMPHITLADDLPQVSIGAALMAAAGQFQPFDSSLDRVEIVRFRPVIRLWQSRLRAA